MNVPGTKPPPKLSIARELTKDVEGAKTLVIDTERESTLTYADVVNPVSLTG